MKALLEIEMYQLYYTTGDVMKNIILGIIIHVLSTGQCMDYSHPRRVCLNTVIVSRVVKQVKIELILLS